MSESEIKMNYEPYYAVVLLDGSVGYVQDRLHNMITVNLLDGSTEIHSSDQLRLYRHLYSFKPGEEVMHICGQRGVVVGVDKSRNLGYVKFDGVAVEAGISLNVLTHKHILSTTDSETGSHSPKFTKEMARSWGRLRQAVCDKCNGTGEIVLFQLPVKCECQDG